MSIYIMAAVRHLIKKLKMLIQHSGRLHSRVVDEVVEHVLTSAITLRSKSSYLSTYQHATGAVAWPSGRNGTYGCVDCT